MVEFPDVWMGGRGSGGGGGGGSGVGVGVGCSFNPAGVPTATHDAGEPPEDGGTLEDGGSPGECGDGILNTGEECDDENSVPGDGCSSACEVEPGWVCTGEPSVCQYTCGNGEIDPGEECEGSDLGGKDCTTVPGGYTGGALACGASCRFDTTGCTLPGCGDGEVSGSEECDDGNASNEDACLNNCKNASCGDGFVWSGQEGCDDGNPINTDACLNDCSVASCGDGVVWEGQEDCDDGNGVMGDGCDGSCTQEPGWDCSSGSCVPICGDGLVVGDEECDDTNVTPGDGCNGACEEEEGWDCTSGSCVPICGDGVLVGDEECDDNNGVAGDGCDASCAVEPFAACHGEPSQCQCVVYVNEAVSTVSPTGESWSHPLSSLHQGIQTASEQLGGAFPYCSVWVVQGTYGTNTPFVMASDVYLFGGFSGGETARVDAANEDEANDRDLMGRTRFDSPATDTGVGTPTFVDMGALEYHP